MADATLSRREFLKTLGVGTFAVLTSGSPIKVIAQGHDGGHTLIQVFLRGACDTLNMVVPGSGPDRQLYEQARPTLSTPAQDLLVLDDHFGLNPRMTGIKKLYDQGDAAVIVATGLTHDTRSHFDAQMYMELGTPGIKSTSQGWMSRYLQAAGTNPSSLAVVALPGSPTSLLGNHNFVSMNSIGDMEQWSNGLLEEMQAVQRQLFTGKSQVDLSGERTLDMLELLAPHREQDKQADNGAKYPDSSLGRQLESLAKLLKIDAGLQLANVDDEDWDMHENECDHTGGYLFDKLENLSQSISAFFIDIGKTRSGSVTVEVISEFGRRLVQNQSRGTDHGHGSAMLVIGGGVQGGKVLGDWPGLANEVLYDHADLAITTDYRQVISEILVNRMGLQNPESVFPGFAYSPNRLGLFA